MYIWDFSRSEGAGSATRRKTRGLTRSVRALMVPPLPAASRPSKMMITRRRLNLTHSWRWHNSPWSLRNSFMYFLLFSFLCPLDSEFLFIRWFSFGLIISQFVTTDGQRSLSDPQNCFWLP